MENEMEVQKVIILAAILIGVAAIPVWTLLTPRKELHEICGRCLECGEMAYVNLDTGECFCVDCYNSYVAVSEEADKGEYK